MLGNEKASRDTQALEHGKGRLIGQVAERVADRLLRLSSEPLHTLPGTQSCSAIRRERKGTVLFVGGCAYPGDAAQID